ncbi:MAG: hypothetical protein IJ458_03515 [Clostridia bacterium]|nr:hypothetical protein [Clostridia bacterium]
MYKSSNLIIYSENNIELKNDLVSLISQCDVAFKELHSLSVLFSSIKNPQYHLIIIVKSVKFLKMIQNIAKTCHNYQNRIFIVFSSSGIDDLFFNNCCNFNQIYKVKDFIVNNIQLNTIQPQHQTSNLINKLVKLELENLDISSKYVGFKYLTDVLANALSINFFGDNYINLFEYVASIHLANIDTIERDVRHMLLSTWKNSPKFRNTIQNHLNLNKKPNSKNILNAVLNYLKNVI